VNFMANKLTAQVRNIADVCDRHPRCGDLSRKITVDVQGEILESEEYNQTHGSDRLNAFRLLGQPRVA